MALTPNFTCTQLIGLPANILLADTSTGSDVTITSRRIYFQQANAEYLVPEGTTTDYVVWTWPTATITVDLMDKDYSLSIKVDWLNVSNAIVETKTILFVFTSYGEEFLYRLTQAQAGNPTLINDGHWFENKSLIRTDLDSAVQAVALASDQAAAQDCLDRTTEMIENAQYLFLANA